MAKLYSKKWKNLCFTKKKIGRIDSSIIFQPLLTISKAKTIFEAGEVVGKNRLELDNYETFWTKFKSVKRVVIPIKLMQKTHV